MKHLPIAAAATLFFAATVVVVADLIVVLSPTANATGASGAQTKPAFEGIDTWINSAPLSLDGLRGKVVLVDFWTYTCVNCLNHLPYVQDWDGKYRDQGLVVVGIHTPEFAFEKSTTKVKDAVERLKIRYPVAQDNDYATWKSFGNHFWPAIYLIDKQGRVVYSHFGEGRYRTTEGKVQALLAEPVAAAN